MLLQNSNFMFPRSLLTSSCWTADDIGFYTLITYMKDTWLFAISHTTLILNRSVYQQWSEEVHSPCALLS